MADLIARTRPTDEGLARTWTPEVRRRILRDVLADTPSGAHRWPHRPDRPGRPRRSRRARRAWPLAAAAAVVAALLLAIPVAFPGWLGGAPAASALDNAARGAGAQPRLEWSAGQFLRVRSVATQNGMMGLDERGRAQNGSLRTTYDDFYDPDGWVWSDRVVDGQVQRYIFPPSWGWARPGYAATMPTEKHALDAFLRARALGSTSQDEAVFVAIGDMLRQEAAPPQVRAAAIGVLGLNPKVTVTQTDDPRGRPALKVTFVDEATRPGMQQFLYLAPDTGVLLASGSDAPEMRYLSVISDRQVVNALPAEHLHQLGTERVGKEVTDGKTTPIDSARGADPVPVPEQSYTTPPQASGAPAVPRPGTTATASR